MDESEAFDAALRSVTSRPSRFLRRLLWLYGTSIAVVSAVLSVAVWRIDSVHPVQALTLQAIADGFGAMLIAALLLALVPATETYVMTVARKHSLPETLLPQAARPAGWSLAALGPGFAARTGQGVIVP